MRNACFVSALLAVVPAFTALPAAAAVVAFTGSSFNVNPPARSGPPCAAPLLDLRFGPADTGGTSNLGDFTYTQAHCAVGGPGAYGGGVFTYFFASGDTLAGTYGGALAPTAVMGLLANHIEFTVTSGTGIFREATGIIVGDGTLDLRGAAARADLRLNGSLDLRSVPEPASAALLLTGFGAIGALRGRRRAGRP